MNHAYRYGAVFAALVLTACGGGGGGSSPLPSATAPSTGGGSSGSTPTPAPTTTPAPGPSQSQPVSAASGGTVQLTVGSSTLTLTIPQNALDKDSTVKLGLYPIGGAPKSSSAKKANALPSGAHVLSAFWIDLGGAKLLKPMTFSQSGVSSVPSGVSVRLAKYSLALETYYDVDTGEVVNGNLFNDTAKGFVGITSGAGQAEAYEFYAAPTSSLAAPATIQLHLAPSSAATSTIGGTQNFLASGQDAHGNVYFFTPRFAVDNANVGSVASSPSDPYTAVVTFAGAYTPGNLTASDPNTGASASISIALASEHPVTGGSTFAYAGTLTQQTVRNVTPTSEPAPTAVPSIPPSNVNATVAQTVTVTPNQNYNGVSNLYDLTTNETRTTQLQSSSSVTHAYYGFNDNGGETDFVLYGSDWADDNHNTVSYQYTNPQLIDRLPETGGDSWKNSPAMNFYENDSVDSSGSAFVSTSVVLDDASYVNKIDYPAGYVVPGTSVEADITQGKNGSGSYVAPFFGAAIDTINYSAPSLFTTSPLVYHTTANLYNYPNAPTSDTSPYDAITLNVWYPTARPLTTDQTVNNGQQSIPTACNLSASFNVTTANQVVRTIDRYDTILGYHENQTTTSYTVPGLGTVCMQMQDVMENYYNFSWTFSYLEDMFSAQKFQTTTTSETLTLQPNGTSISPDAKRRTASASASPMLMAKPSTVGFLRLVNHARVNQSRALIQAVRNTKKGSTH
jgi:hypothetical protein